MQVGNLRRRVLFQRKTYTKDSSGQDLHIWGDITSPALIRSASIKPVKGQELVEARAQVDETLVSIMVRYDPETGGVTTDDRIVHYEVSPARVYAIHAKINHEERDRWIEFWCSEGMQDKYTTDTAVSALLLESGDYLLLESGDYLLLES